MRKRHLLITGLPGTGKTTLLVRLIRRLTDFHPTGFYTEEIREGGVRQGFRLVSVDGKEGMLAHLGLHVRNRVGRYGVDLKGFESFLADLDLSGSSGQLVFIDDIGKMECLSSRFVELMCKLLASPKTVVATVALKGGGFIADVKLRTDCEIKEVTMANREKLVEELAAWVIERMGP
jgi:nucleoside-triphosphatase